MNKANMAVTLTGTNVTEDGNVHVINEKCEGVRAILQIAFMDVDEETHRMSVACCGAFTRKYYVEIIEKVIEVIGREEFETALSYIRLKEIVKRAAGYVPGEDDAEGR